MLMHWTKSLHSVELITWYKKLGPVAVAHP